MAARAEAAEATGERIVAAVADRRSAQIWAERDLAVPPMDVGDVGAATRNLVDSYERWGDEQLHLVAQERRTGEIGAAIGSARRYHHDWVERVFSPWLGDLPAPQRRRRLAGLVAITDHVWKVLRRDEGLSRQEAEAALRDLVARLLAP